MPTMKIHTSGGIVFVPTKEERELRQMKHELKKELEDVKSLKKELLQLRELMGGEVNADS